MENIYISDYLRKNLPLMQYEIWHATNFEMPVTAYDYVDKMGQKWMANPKAIELLQLLHIAEPSRFEIDHFYALKSELYYADNGFENEQFIDMRKQIMEDIESFKENITPESSQTILKKWKESTVDDQFKQFLSSNYASAP